MRKLAIAVALSTTVLAGPALARDGAWYVGGDFGAMIVEDTDLAFTPGNVGNPNPSATGLVTIDWEEGYDGSLFVGYDLGGFRIEVEGSYKKADVDEIQSNFGLPGTVRPGGLFTGGNGEMTTMSLMLNGMLDFGDDEGLSGFIGGGVGMARVNIDNLSAFTNTGVALDDNDTRFAWQIVAGIRQALSPNVDIHLRYRFFNVDDLEMTGFGGLGGPAAGRAVSTDLRTHSLLGGITFNFGNPVVPVICDAPNFLNEAGVCVAPAPRPVVCGPGERLNPATNACEMIPVEPRYRDCPGGTRVLETEQCPTVALPPAIVYFGWDEDDLTDRARQTLNEVAQNYRATGQAAVTLAGHADRSGSAGYNVGLSQRRANAVRDYLVSLGVPGGSITSQAFGETRPAVETADGVREPDNRRVEITFGPGSGW
jgi:outer membrane protein OmpA-like peptidoglycan-associated protein/opacity protein-like surface antigen